MATSKNESGSLDRILVADDDRDFLRALEHWLSEYDDVDVTSVTSGADAVEAIDSSVDVFLCDRRMPELSGSEVIDRIREKGYDVPTIVISAYPPDSYLHEDDVDRYLHKPIDRTELYDALDEVAT